MNQLIAITDEERAVLRFIGETLKSSSDHIESVEPSSPQLRGMRLAEKVALGLAGRPGVSVVLAETAAPRPSGEWVLEDGRHVFVAGALKAPAG